MIELGKKQTLVVVREKDFGIYLSEKQGDEASVLLPKKQVPAGTKIGDSIEVFIYKDSEDRLIATTQMPKLQVGEVGGSDTPIVVVGREAGSGTRGAFEEILKVEDACKYAVECDSTGAAMAKVASTLLFVFTRPFAAKHLMKNVEKTNVDSLIGKEGIVKQEINNLEARGVVKLSGMEWSARSADDSKIAAGEKVLVQSIDGVKLIVTKSTQA